MQDAVAEVLNERERLDRHRATGLVASLAMHSIVVLMVFVGGKRHSPTETPTIINMRLMPASSPAAAPSRVRSASRPSQDPSRAIVAPTPKIATPPAVVATPKPGKVDPARSSEKTLFGKSEAPAVARTTPAPAAGASASGKSASSQSNTDLSATPAVGTAGVGGLEGGDFPYAYYIERMLSLIGQHWFRPQTGGELITRVYFEIERDGRIREPKIESGSGNSLFDRAAYRAVLESSPLPPLPFQYSGNYLGVHLIFH